MIKYALMIVSQRLNFISKEAKSALMNAKKQKMECKNIFIIIQRIIYVSNSVTLVIIFTQRNLLHHMKNVTQNAQVDIITLLKILINVLMDAQKLILILLKIIILIQIIILFVKLFPHVVDKLFYIMMDNVLHHRIVKTTINSKLIQKIYV